MAPWHCEVAQRRMRGRRHYVTSWGVVRTSTLVHSPHSNCTPLIIKQPCDLPPFSPHLCLHLSLGISMSCLVSLLSTCRFAYIIDFVCRASFTPPLTPCLMSHEDSPGYSPPNTYTAGQRKPTPQSVIPRLNSPDGEGE